MASPTVVEETRTGKSRWQLSLMDLSFLVLAAAVGVGIARGARDVWGMRRNGTMPASPVPFARTAGLAMEVAAVWLAVILARGMLGLLRGRRQSGGAIGRPRFLASMAWRAMAILLLSSLAMGQSWILRVDLATFEARKTARVGVQPSNQVGWHEWYNLRETLIPVCAILAMIGLALGAGAGATFARSGPRLRRPYWLFVPLAALAGVLMLGQSNGWWSLIAQFVVIALEAVNNAMRPEYRATTDSLSVRLLRAAVETVPAAVTCLWLALVVARDFEWERRARPWGTTRGGWVVRLFSLATAIGAGTFAALDAIPTIQPHFFYGFCRILEPEVVGMMLAGFGIFAAGLAARTLVPPSSGERPRWMIRLSAAVSLGLLAVVLVATLQCVPSSTQLDPAVPAIVGKACDLARELPAWLWSIVPDRGAINFAAWLEPERLTWTLATMASALFVLELAVSRTVRDQPAPFDEVVGSRGRLVRFVWLTSALTAVCLVALPALIVIGQAIIHIRLFIESWTVHGWPSPF